MKKANKRFSTLLKKIIFPIHELNHINHRHVCVFIAQVFVVWNYFQTCIEERERIKRARAMNAMQKYGVLFTPAHTYVHETVANFMMRV